MDRARTLKLRNTHGFLAINERATEENIALFLDFLSFFPNREKEKQNFIFFCGW